MKALRLYVAGKVSKESSFGTHHWREEFCQKLEILTKMKIVCLDPTLSGIKQEKPEIVFGGDAYLIKHCDVFVVYLSDDISVGGSQEILIAKFFKKPVIGLAPKGGKFNGRRREFFGEVIEDYKDPFVYATCDVVVEDINQLATALQEYKAIKPRSIQCIGDMADAFERDHLQQHPSIREMLKNN